MDLQDHLLRQRPNLSPSQAANAAAALFGVSGDAKPLQAERDQNFHLRCEDGAQFVLKIANAMEDADVLAFQNAALETLRAIDPDLPIPNVLKSIDGRLTATHTHEGTTYLVRLVSFMPGVPLSTAPRSAGVHCALGTLLGRLDAALMHFSPAGV